MAKKKRPNQPANKNVPASRPAPVPVAKGDVFATFISEAQSLGNEVANRRALQNDVAEFLSMKNLVEEFNTWQKAKHAPPPQVTPPQG